MGYNPSMPRRDDKTPNWGPNVTNAFPVKGAIGLIVSVGLIFGILAAVPQARLWLFISVPLGIVIGLALHYLRR